VCYSEWGFSYRKAVGDGHVSRGKQLFNIRRRAAPLKSQEIKRRRLAAGQNGKAGVCLSTVMRLMIEQVQQYVAENLGLGHSRRGFVSVQAPQCRFIIYFDDCDQSLILCDTCSSQFHTVCIQDSIETIWVIALTGEALQPETVGKQEMV